MAGYELRSIDEMATANEGIVKLAGAELGVESFGIQVPDYPEHDHAEEGMEEVYVVLGGSAEFEVEGERVPIEPGRILRIAAESRRKLLPGPDGVRILAIGAAPGQSYERPEGLELPSRG